jgi:serine/threonine protein kinase
MASLAQDNILINNELQPCLTDFGLASVIEMQSRTTSGSAGVSGSVRWLAPEVLQGDPRTCASDVYAFALTCLEVCSSFCDR